jgi:hypothetical protein
MFVAGTALTKGCRLHSHAEGAEIGDLMTDLFGKAHAVVQLVSRHAVSVVRYRNRHNGLVVAEKAVISPFREHLVDGRVVDQGGAVSRSGYWHALPLHTRIEDPQDQVENAMITQFAFRPAAGHRQVREDKCDELRP